MKCMKCQQDFPEEQIEESHDIPKYLGGTDKDGRHHLCRRCHQIYELKVLSACLRILGEKFESQEEMIFLQKEIKRLKDKLKSTLRKEADKIRKEFFKNG